MTRHADKRNREVIVGGAALIIGLLMRLAALGLALAMAGAILFVHLSPDPGGRRSLLG